MDVPKKCTFISFSSDLRPDIFLFLHHIRHAESDIQTCSVEIVLSVCADVLFRLGKQPWKKNRELVLEVPFIIPPSINAESSQPTSEQDSEFIHQISWRDFIDIGFILSESGDPLWNGRHQSLPSVEALNWCIANEPCPSYVACLCAGLLCLKGLVLAIAQRYSPYSRPNTRSELSLIPEATNWKARLVEALEGFTRNNNVSQLCFMWNLSHDELPELPEIRPDTRGMHIFGSVMRYFCRRLTASCGHCTFDTIYTLTSNAIFLLASETPMIP